MTGEDRATLLAKRTRIDRRLRALAIAERKRQRRDDTRRKIIAGALALEHATIRPDFAVELAALLNRYVTRPQDRVLFHFLDDRRPEVTQAMTQGFAAVVLPAGDGGSRT